MMTRLDDPDEALAPTPHDDRESVGTRGRQQILAEIERLRKLRLAMAGGAPAGRAIAASTIVTQESAHAAVLRNFGARCMVVDIGGNPWPTLDSWLQRTLSADDTWADVSSAPLAPAAANSVETIHRMLSARQAVVLARGEAMSIVLALLESRGVPAADIQQYVRWMPAGLALTPAILSEWFALGCPGESVSEGDIALGRFRWSTLIYEKVFLLMLTARLGRDRVRGGVTSSRVIMNLLIWLREGSDTALRAILAEGADMREAGVVRCSAKSGMLLCGVAWRVIHAEDVTTTTDEAWLGFLHSEMPEVHGRLAALGWNYAQDVAEQRHRTLKASRSSDLSLATHGLLTLDGTKLAPDLVVHEGQLWRREVPLRLDDISIQGEEGSGPEAIAGRLAFHVATAAANGALGIRRRVRVTLQRALGAAEIPPPTVVLHLPWEWSGGSDAMLGRLLNFHWSMPVERRRRDLTSAIELLRTTSLAPDNYLVPESLGAGCAAGLLSLDSSSAFFGPAGEALSGYLWSGFSHVFQPEYSLWVANRLQKAAAEGRESRTALQQVVSDLAAVFV